jgi:helix-turn-helix protein
MDNKIRDYRAKDWSRFKLSKVDIVAGLDTLKILLNNIESIESTDWNNNKLKVRKWLRK